MTSYYTAENVAKPGGKVHRVRRDNDSTTLCGIRTVGTAWAFTGGDELADGEDGCVRCWRPRPLEPTVDDTVESLIVDHVTRATDCYAHGMPGHGLYLMTRLRLKLERLERVVDEARDALHRA